MKDVLILGLAVLAATAWGSAVAQDALTDTDKAAIDAAVAQLAGSGSDPGAAARYGIEQIIRETADRPAAHAHLAGKLAGVLESAKTNGERTYLCRLLWVLGNEQALSTLEAMLVKDETCDLACYALSQDTSSPAIAEALLRALNASQGRARVAVINLFGSRRDAAAIAPLVPLAKSEDEATAMAAIAALGKIGGPDAASALAEIHASAAGVSRTASSDALLWCAETFAKDGDSTAASRIYESLLDPSNSLVVRRAAAFGLERVTEARPLFDGQTFAGWEGDLNWFRIEEGAIVAGNLEKAVPHNLFLCTAETFGDFDLRLKVKLLGGDTANAGIQIRSQRVPDNHEVSGYQADMGQNYWGCLYDESRRNRVLVQSDQAKLGDVLRPGDWNDYRIRCLGRHVQLWLNGVLTVDYTETEEDIPQSGIIGLQIHGGPASEAWYKDISLTPLRAYE